MRKNNETRDEYVSRLVKIKNELPGHGITSLAVKMFPEYDNPTGRRRISNVLNFRVYDDNVLNVLNFVSSSVKVIRDVNNLATTIPNDETFGAAVRQYLQNVGR